MISTLCRKLQIMVQNYGNVVKLREPRMPGVKRNDDSEKP